MVAHMEMNKVTNMVIMAKKMADMELDMVAVIEVDKVADKVADMVAVEKIANRYLQFLVDKEQPHPEKEGNI